MKAIKNILLDRLFRNIKSVQEVRKYIRKYIHDRELNSYDENDHRLNNPIFVWGLARSGTFLLYDILSLHEDLVCQRFPVGVNRPYKGLWGSKHWGGGGYEELTRGLGAPVEGRWRFSGTDSYDCPWIQDTEKKLSKETIKHIRLYYAALFGQEKEGKLATRLLDKYPTYILITELIDQVFPDATHIWCVRDPRSILRSTLRMQIEVFKNESHHAGLMSGMIPAGFEEYLKKEFVMRHCWQVVSLVEKGFSNVKLLGKRVIMVHHEAICSKPKEVFTQLFELAKLPKTSLLPPRLPEKFEQYADHPKDDFWKNYITNIINGEGEMGSALVELSQKLKYGQEVGRLESDFSPRMPN